MCDAFSLPKGRPHVPGRPLEYTSVRQPRACPYRASKAPLVLASSGPVGVLALGALALRIRTKRANQQGSRVNR